MNALTLSLLALVVLAAGCMRSEPVSQTSGAGESGIIGTATVDQGCPVLEDEQPCPTEPLAARIEAYREGVLIDRTESDDDGAFRLPLPPGRYEVRGGTLDGAPVPTLKPVQVTVTGSEFVRISLEFDSGVRGPE